MENMKRSILCMVCAFVMLLSMVAFPGLSAQATAEDPITEERIIYDFYADDFVLPYAPDSGDAVEEDSASAYGKADVLSYAKRVPTNDKGLTSAMIRAGDQVLGIYTYGGNPKIITEVGQVTQSQLRANAEAGGYIMYHFEDVELFPTADEYFIYIFDCWGFQVRFTEDQRAAIQGQYVDLYVSLKVTGDISATEGNTPTYYIDRVTVATAEEGSDEHEHTYGEWKAANDFNHEAICTTPGCGEAKTEAHAWGEGVVTKEPTTEASGIETYTCSVCHATRTKKLAMLSGGSSNVNTPSNQDGQQQNQTIDPIVWIAVGLFVVAAVVIVVAVIVKKRGKK